MKITHADAHYLVGAALQLAWWSPWTGLLVWLIFCPGVVNAFCRDRGIDPLGGRR